MAKIFSYLLFAFFAFILAASNSWAQAKIFFTQGSSIQSIPSSGGSASTVLSGLVSANGVAYDSTRHELFYLSTANGGSIFRANADGSNIRTVLSSLGISNLFAIEVDAANQQIYFVDSSQGGGGSIQRVNYDGSGRTTLISGLNEPYSIGLDLVNSMIYFTEYQTGSLFLANLDGSSAVNLINLGANTLTAVVVDPTNNRIFYADFLNGSVHVASLVGSGAIQIMSGLSGPFNLDIDPDSSKLVVSTQNSPMRILRCNFDGSGSEDLFTPSSSAFGIAYAPVVPTPTPTATVTSSPTATATESPTASPVSTVVSTPASPMPTATPIGTGLTKAPTPHFIIKEGTLIIRLKDTVNGSRDYYVVLVNTASESLYRKVRVRMRNGRGQAVVRAVPTGTYRAYTLVFTSSGKKHSEFKLVEI